MTKAFFSSIRLAAGSIACAVIWAAASVIARGQFRANRISLPQDAETAAFCGNITVAQPQYHAAAAAYHFILAPPRLTLVNLTENTR